MRIIVSDSSCLIDIRKASLIDAFLKLPYEILIPDTLFEDELLKFTDVQKRALISGGIKIIDLPPGDSVLRAQQAVREGNRSHPPALLPPAPWQGVDSSSTTVLVASGV
ncbi:MAG TPA: hypothetical protein PKI24_20465 [Nitrospira sp.]|nr:hypothetical protein [Nitrospira sp.]HNP41985.1 hypothetical protein [Nitrospira sp.]